MSNRLKAFSKVFALCALASFLMGQTRVDDDPPMGAQERRYYPKRQDDGRMNARDVPVDNAGPAELSEPPLGHGYARKRKPAQNRGDVSDGPAPRVVVQPPMTESEMRRARRERWERREMERARETGEEPPIARQR